MARLVAQEIIYGLDPARLPHMSIDRLTAYAQILLSVLFLSGYFIVLILFMLGYARIPPDYKEAFAGLLTLMTGGGLTILYFWFQRAKNIGSPDPATTTTHMTQTTTPVLQPEKPDET